MGLRRAGRLGGQAPSPRLPVSPPPPGPGPRPATLPPGPARSPVQTSDSTQPARARVFFSLLPLSPTPSFLSQALSLSPSGSLPPFLSLSSLYTFSFSLLSPPAPHSLSTILISHPLPPSPFISESFWAVFSVSGQVIRVTSSCRWPAGQAPAAALQPPLVAAVPVPAARLLPRLRLGQSAESSQEGGPVGGALPARLRRSHGVWPPSRI